MALIPLRVFHPVDKDAGGKQYTVMGPKRTTKDPADMNFPEEEKKLHRGGEWDDEKPQLAQEKGRSKGKMTKKL